jgi:spore coat polysaccharide biosynthesis protein SpsF
VTTIAVVQARAGSSRLPGKVLQPINGVPMLRKVIDRMRRSTELDEIVVATTREPGDDAVADLATAAGVAVVRGDQFDVLDRFHDVLLARPDAATVVRVTADCPFIDPGIIDRLVRLRRDEGADFVANRLPPPAVRTYPVGLDVEVCTAAALQIAWRDAVSPFEREHVMPHLYGEPDRFRVVVDQLDEDLSALRWTVDEPADLEAARAIDAACGPEPYDWRHVLETVRAHPELAEINAGLTQKQVDVVDERWGGGA